MPQPTEEARQLLAAMERSALERGWEKLTSVRILRSARILTAWLGAEVPFTERDVRALSRCGRSSARRLLALFREHGLVVPDPRRKQSVHQRWVDAKIKTLPSGIDADVRTWVKVLRGEGRFDHAPLDYQGIRRNLGYLHPVLVAWGQSVSSLREVTAAEITAVMEGRQGNHARGVQSALKSLFRALRQEKVIFRDPTRALTLPTINKLPPSIPSDRLAGLLDRINRIDGRLIVALVAIHALTKRVTKLRKADPDLAAGRLVVRRPSTRHVVHLDPITHQLAAAWLRDRHQRWPLSANTHLFVSQQTALDPSDPPISRPPQAISKGIGLSMSDLRQDRIREEAVLTGDPLHLMQLFGVSSNTAMRYIGAAHPERIAKPPR